MVQLMPPHPKTPSSLASFKSRLGFTFLVLFLTPNQQCQRLKALLLLADFVASFPVAPSTFLKKRLEKWWKLV